MTNNPNSSPSPEHLQPPDNDTFKEELLRTPIADTPLTRPDLYDSPLEEMIIRDTPLTRYGGRPYEYEMTSMPEPVESVEFIRKYLAGERWTYHDLEPGSDTMDPSTYLIRERTIGSIAASSVGGDVPPRDGDDPTPPGGSEVFGEVFDDAYWAKTEDPSRELDDGVTQGGDWVDAETIDTDSTSETEYVLGLSRQTHPMPVTLDELSSAGDDREQPSLTVSPEDSRLAAEEFDTNIGHFLRRHGYNPDAAGAAEGDEPPADTGGNVRPRDNDGPPLPGGSDEFNGPGEAGDGQPDNGNFDEGYWAKTERPQGNDWTRLSDDWTESAAGAIDGNPGWVDHGTVTDPTAAEQLETAGERDPHDDPRDASAASEASRILEEAMHRALENLKAQGRPDDAPPDEELRAAIESAIDAHYPASEWTDLLADSGISPTTFDALPPEVSEIVAREVLARMQRAAREAGIPTRVFKNDGTGNPVEQTGTPLGDNASPPEAAADTGIQPADLSDLIPPAGSPPGMYEVDPRRRTGHPEVDAEDGEAGAAEE